MSSETQSNLVLSGVRGSEGPGHRPHSNDGEVNIPIRTATNERGTAVGQLMDKVGLSKRSSQEIQERRKANLQRAETLVIAKKAEHEKKKDDKRQQVIERAKELERQKQEEIENKQAGKLDEAEQRRKKQLEDRVKRMAELAATEEHVQRAAEIQQKKVEQIVSKTAGKLDAAEQRRLDLQAQVAKHLAELADAEAQVKKAEAMERARKEDIMKRRLEHLEKEKERMRELGLTEEIEKIAKEIEEMKDKTDGNLDAAEWWERLYGKKTKCTKERIKAIKKEFKGTKKEPMLRRHSAPLAIIFESLIEHAVPRRRHSAPSAADHDHHHHHQQQEQQDQQQQQHQQRQHKQQKPGAPWFDGFLLFAWLMSPPGADLFWIGLWEGRNSAC
ncbi:unnamed protein product [Vitrella brassicaformis CCMP3155]|uniref:Uncharacterized protein n=2 Tax=Vitrella brassicaformis TaxID=1169539 RepID=A0A0G4FUG3_VITBC|nr:unnamed protein product [Vitrella brassicaformis CCMP3155]|eukprot:CEM18573.1 unnamed protein product [Vitrella brassicaformis CCMP3155]